MKLQDVRRIREEQAARALWQTGGRELNLAAVDEIIARKEAAAAWVGRRTKLFNRILLALAAAVYVWGFSATEDPGAWFFGGLFYGFLLWLAGWIAIASRYPIWDDDDLAFATRLRRSLDQEAEGVRRLRARAARNETFALYLRTFSAETRAMTYGEVQSMRASIYASVPEDGRGRPMPGAEAWAQREASQLKDEWTLKRRIVEAIAAVLPVVCLGNINLQDDKRSQLTALGVDEATVVTADWWQLFEELDAKSVLTFVVLDALTREISRELDHLMSRGRPFLVACSASANQELSALDSYRRLLEHPAVRHVVVSEHDLAPLQSALAAVLPSF